MKRTAAIGLILIMSLQCFYNLGVIAYFQLNQEYIAEVLCINRETPITTCNGQCFLQQNLDVSDDTNRDDGTLPVGKQRIDAPIFLITENNYSFPNQKKREQNNSPYLFALSSAHSRAPFHPPAFQA